MGSIEKAKKKRGFDAGLFSRAEQLANLVWVWNPVVSYWKLVDQEYRDARRLIRDSRERVKAARSLRDADRDIKILAPMLRNFIQVPSISLFHETNAWENIKVTDLLAAGGLLWIASFVEGWKSEPGPRSEIYAIRCAEELAEEFKKQTGYPHWAWVGEIVANNFPSVYQRTKQMTAPEICDSG